MAPQVGLNGHNTFIDGQLDTQLTQMPPSGHRMDKIVDTIHDILLTPGQIEIHAIFLRQLV